MFCDRVLDPQVRCLYLPVGSEAWIDGLNLDLGASRSQGAPDGLQDCDTRLIRPLIRRRDRFGHEGRKDAIAVTWHMHPFDIQVITGYRTTNQLTAVAAALRVLECEMGVESDLLP